MTKAEHVANVAHWLKTKTRNMCPLCGYSLSTSAETALNDLQYTIKTYIADGQRTKDLISMMVECRQCGFRMFFNNRILWEKPIREVFTGENSTVRIRSAFLDMKIDTVGDLLRIGRKRLQTVRGIGKTSFGIIETVLKKEGLQLPE